MTFFIEGGWCGWNGWDGYKDLCHNGTLINPSLTIDNIATEVENIFVLKERTTIAKQVGIRDFKIKSG